MFSGRMWGKVSENKCLGSRIIRTMWVKLKLDGETVVVVCMRLKWRQRKKKENDFGQDLANA